MRPSFSLLLPSSPSAFLPLIPNSLLLLLLYHIGSPPTSLYICNFLDWFQKQFIHEKAEREEETVNEKGGRTTTSKNRNQRRRRSCDDNGCGCDGALTVVATCQCEDAHMVSDGGWRKDNYGGINRNEVGKGCLAGFGYHLWKCWLLV